MSEKEKQQRHQVSHDRSSQKDFNPHTPGKMKKTKKAKLLEIFNSVEWDERMSKTFLKDHFDAHDLYISAGYGEDESTYKYFASLMNKMGHSVCVGIGVYVFKDRLANYKKRIPPEAKPTKE